MNLIRKLFKVTEIDRNEDFFPLSSINHFLKFKHPDRTGNIMVSPEKVCDLPKCRQNT